MAELLPGEYGVPGLITIIETDAAEPPHPGARKIGRVWFTDDATIMPLWIYGGPSGDGPISDLALYILTKSANNISECDRKFFDRKKIVDVASGDFLFDFKKQEADLFPRKKKGVKPRTLINRAIKELVYIGLAEEIERTKNYTILRPILDSAEAIGAISESDCLREMPPDWLKRRAQVFERDKHTCQYCGCQEVPFECDHIVPMSKGGGHDLENLTTACKPCNRSKGARLLDG